MSEKTIPGANFALVSKALSNIEGELKIIENNISQVDRRLVDKEIRSIVNKLNSFLVY